MNCLNDSRKFQEVESNYSGKNSHIPSQPAVVPSPRSVLSRDKRLPLDTWNLSGPQENVFGNPRHVFDASQTPHEGILHSAAPRATGKVPVHGSTGTLVARDEERLGSTIPMPMFAGRPSTMNSYLPADTPQNSLLDSKDSRFRNFNLINSPHLQRFHVGR